MMTKWCFCASVLLFAPGIITLKRGYEIFFWIYSTVTTQLLFHISYLVAGGLPNAEAHPKLYNPSPTFLALRAVGNELLHLQ
jgi:hypothetical protein